MTALRLRPHLATIPPNEPFLPTLAAWWLARTAERADPLTAADGLFILPTRRAARGLALAFGDAAGGRPLLLPRIAALGGLEEAPLAAPLGMEGALDIPPPVAPARRLAVLTRLILAMRGADGAPTQADRAWVLAGELARLLDEAALAGIDLARALPGAVGEAFAAHWQVTLRFLAVVTHAWPDWLAEEGVSDVAAHGVALLDAQVGAWRAAPPQTPVIAAGSTGAVPAVGRLLRLVAHLPDGLVVLPGLDRTLDAESWDALDEGHPQAGLLRILAALDARREDVADFAELAGAACLPPLCPQARVAAWRTALLPAARLHLWQSPQALDVSGLERLEPADQQEEALSVALVLREALEVPGARAALVTPDRQLAGRVAAELLRFGVVADDSAGERLADVPAALFLRLLAEAVREELRPVPLLALLKHPLCAAGLSPAACRRAARQLERACLRGPRPGPGIEGLRQHRGERSFLDRLAHGLRPMLELAASGGTAAPDRVLAALLEAAEALAGTDTAPGATRLWAGEDGAALASHLSELRQALPVLPAIRITDLPELLDATLGDMAVRSRRALRGREGAEHPRLFIWGVLEARLQTADLVVLAGLTEGTWPPLAESGPWMNRPMRTAVGLPSPEERVGQAAHDFVMACCAAPRAVLSAPRRRDGAPAVPSRWLVRLEALLQGHGRALDRHPAALWARALDQPDGGPMPVRPPAPAPDVALRPRRLSVTEIGTWLRDPYAIYARRVLGLCRLDPLEQSADAADYGKIVHEGLRRFFKRAGLAWPPDAAALLAADMDAALDDSGMRPALLAWWRPRLRRIAAWVAETECHRRLAGPPHALETEVKGDWVFDAPAGPFTLHGRADRIERRADGTVAILDYKTGQTPSGKDVEEGRAPQLPLEAAMVRRDAFGPALAGEVAELTYWHITGGSDPGKVVSLFKGDVARTAEVAALAEDKLRELVAVFDDAGQPYLSQPGAAPRFSEYARLARVAEWGLAEEE